MQSGWPTKVPPGVNRKSITATTHLGKTSKYAYVSVVLKLVLRRVFAGPGVRDPDTHRQSWFLLISSQNYLTHESNLS